MRAFRIPAALLVVASLALIGCGDITGPSAEAAPQFKKPSNDQGDQQPCVLVPEATVCPEDEGDQGDGEGQQDGDGNGEAN